MYLPSRVCVRISPLAHICLCLCLSVSVSVSVFVSVSVSVSVCLSLCRPTRVSGVQISPLESLHLRLPTCATTRRCARTHTLTRASMKIATRRRPKGTDWGRETDQQVYKPTFGVCVCVRACVSSLDLITCVLNSKLSILHSIAGPCLHDSGGQSKRRSSSSRGDAVCL